MQESGQYLAVAGNGRAVIIYVEFRMPLNYGGDIDA
jgi:hypothetical protein